MQNVSRQVPLGLSKDEATFLNYYAGKNEQIVGELKNTVCGRGERIIYLYGSYGHGASHLLQASCHFASQEQVQSVYLPMNQLRDYTPEILAGMEALPLICIDDLRCVAGMREWEEAIFHLFNRIYDAGGRMIFAANDVPKSMGLMLPDLESRLSWGIVYQLQSLTDVEKMHVLAMRAHKRGMNLSDDVSKYILTHYSRHMGALFSALDILDKATLAAPFMRGKSSILAAIQP